MNKQNFNIIFLSFISLTICKNGTWNLKS